MRKTTQMFISFGERGHVLAVLLEHLARLDRREDDQPGEDLGAYRVELEFEEGDDTEIAAAAAQRPRTAQRFPQRWRATSRPSAVTMSTETRLSEVNPYLRDSQPKPPPRVSPATPVVELMPVGVASPKAWAS